MANPNAIFDTIIVGGNLDFVGATTHELAFSDALTGVDSMVDWTNSFWNSSRLGTSGWLLYDVAGTTSNFGNLSLTLINGLDGVAPPSFATARPGASFSLFLAPNNRDIYTLRGRSQDISSAGMMDGPMISTTARQPLDGRVPSWLEDASPQGGFPWRGSACS